LACQRGQVLDTMEGGHRGGRLAAKRGTRKWERGIEMPVPTSAFHVPRSAFPSPHPEELEPPLVALHDPLAIRRVLWLRERRVPRDDLARHAPGGLEQRQVSREVRVAQRYPAGLSSARQLTHASLLQIDLGDLQPVGGLRER